MQGIFQYKPDPKKVEKKMGVIDEREEKILSALGAGATGLVVLLFLAATGGMIWLGMGGFPWIYLFFGWMFLFLGAVVLHAGLMFVVLILAVWFARN